MSSTNALHAVHSSTTVPTTSAIDPRLAPFQTAIEDAAPLIEYINKNPIKSDNAPPKKWVMRAFDVEDVAMSGLYSYVEERLKAEGLWAMIAEPSATPARLKKIREVKFLPWWNRISIPRLRDQSIPEVAHKHAMRHVWRVVSGETRNYNEPDSVGKINQRDAECSRRATSQKSSMLSKTNANVMQGLKLDKSGLPTTDNPVLHSQMNVMFIDKISDKPLKQVPLRAIATDDGEKLLEANPIAQLKERFIDVKKLKQLIVKKAKFPKDCEVTDIEGQDIVDEMDIETALNTVTNRKLLYLPLYLTWDVEMQDSANAWLSKSGSFADQANGQTPFNEDDSLGGNGGRGGSDESFLPSDESDSGVETRKTHRGSQQDGRRKRKRDDRSSDDDTLSSSSDESRRKEERKEKAKEEKKEEKKAKKNKERSLGSRRNGGTGNPRATPTSPPVQGTVKDSSVVDPLNSSSNNHTPQSPKEHTKKNDALQFSLEDPGRPKERDDDEEKEELNEQTRLANRTEAQQRQDHLYTQAAKQIEHKIARAIERIDEKEWLDAARHFGVKPPEKIFRPETIELEKSWGFAEGIEFYPYQLVEAYQMAVQELSHRNGGVFANTMGMGKTTSVLLMILVGYLHLVCYLEVLEDAKTGRNDRHNFNRLIDLTGDNTVEDNPCPSANRRTFLCPCDPKSIFYGKKPVVSPTLVSGYLNSTDAWINDYRRILMANKWVKKSPEVKWPLEFKFAYPASFKKADKLPEENWLPKQGSEQWREMRPAVDWDCVLERINDDLKAPTHYKDLEGKDAYTNNDWAFAEGVIPEDFPGSTPTRPAPSAGRFIIVAKHSLLEGDSSSRLFYCMDYIRVRCEREVKVKVGRKPHAQIEWKQEHNYFKVQLTVVWGRTIFDEFHRCNSVSTVWGRIYKRLRDCNLDYRWKSWVLSGTPMENGLVELLTFILKALRDQRWIQEEGRYKGNWLISCPTQENPNRVRWADPAYKELDASTSEEKDVGMKMVKEWRRLSEKAARPDGDVTAILSDPEYQSLVERAGKILPVFMFRRTLSTVNPKGVAVKGIPGTLETVYRPAKSIGLADRIAVAEKAISDQAGHPWAFSHSEKVAFASYPGLIDLQVDIASLLGVDKMEAHTGKTLDNWAITPFQDPDVEQRRKGAIQNPVIWKLRRRDGTTVLKKAAFSEDLVRSLCEGSPKYQAVKKLVGDELKKKTFDTTPGIPKDTLKKAKSLIGSGKPIVSLITYYGLCLDFGLEEVEYLPGGLSVRTKLQRLENWKNSVGSRIAVVSVHAFAESITLIESAMVAMMEPQETTAVRDQFMFRIYRIGAREKVMRGYVIYNANSDSEMRQLKKEEWKSGARADLGAAGDADKFAPPDWYGDKDIPFHVDGS